MKYFPGIYRGRVLAHLKNGKCKIHIPGVYPEIFALLPEDKDTTQNNSTNAANGQGQGNAQGSGGLLGSSSSSNAGGILSSSSKTNNTSSNMYDLSATESTETDIYGEPIKWPQLPDAERAAGLEFNTNNKQGIFNYPRLLSYVWCMFERGDPNKPIYFASVTSEDAATGFEYENGFFKNSIESNSATADGNKVDKGLPLAINVGTSAIELFSTSDTSTSTTSSIKLIINSSNNPEKDLKNQEKNIPPPLASIEINSAGHIILSGTKVKIAADTFEVAENSSTLINANSISLTGGNAVNINANNLLTIDTPSTDKTDPTSNTGKIRVGHGNSQMKF